MVSCPECGEEIELEQPYEGKRFDCPNCGVGLEILNLVPLEIDWAYNEPHFSEIWKESEVV